MFAGAVLLLAACASLPSPIGTAMGSDVAAAVEALEFTLLATPEMEAGLDGSAAAMVPPVVTFSPPAVVATTLPCASFVAVPVCVLFVGLDAFEPSCPVSPGFNENTGICGDCFPGGNRILLRPTPPPPAMLPPAAGPKGMCEGKVASEGNDAREGREGLDTTECSGREARSWDSATVWLSSENWREVDRVCRGQLGWCGTDPGVPLPLVAVALAVALGTEPAPGGAVAAAVLALVAWAHRGQEGTLCVLSRARHTALSKSAP